VGVEHEPRTSLPVADSTLATIPQRIGARVLDMVLLAVPLGTLSWLVSDVDLDERVFDSPPWLFWFGWVTISLYEILLTAWRGQTVGKIVARIRVIDKASWNPPRPGRATLRALPMIAGAVPVVGWLLQLAYLPALWTQRRQGLHDRLADTVVVSSDF
jgi:uncharacterized RDD family membrane protein YckC